MTIFPLMRREDNSQKHKIKIKIKERKREGITFFIDAKPLV